MKNLRRSVILALSATTGTGLAACVVYCLRVWTPHPMTLWDSDCSIVCWVFCATLSPIAATVALAVAGSSVVGGWMAVTGRIKGREVLFVSGLLPLPFGILTMAAWWISRRIHQNSDFVRL
ncbi:MAG: hypothetical protein QGH20_01090 [Candidatus Latescibacteria bacterium]|jgi:hypothetical protein|nr:hypothetical protein [Candidatus Latescibacterota bacterium]